MQNLTDHDTYLDFWLQERGNMTDNELLAIIIASKIASFLSMIGSTYVIQDILRDPVKRKEDIYHRVMIGVSASDFIVAFAYFLGTWPMPKGQHLFAIGNEGSCGAAGFLTVIGWLLSPLYNCSLAMYYLLQLKYSLTEQRMKAIEKWFHILPWMVALIAAFVALFTNGLGMLGLNCSTLEGSFAELFDILVYTVAILFVMIAMFVVWKHIRDVEASAAKYCFAAYSSSQAERKRSRSIMVQGVMYAAAMLLVIIPFVIALSIPGSFLSMLQVYILSFLQGFYNAFIYSGKLQKWFYNNDGNFICCSPSTVRTSMRSLFPKNKQKKSSSSSPNLTQSEVVLSKEDSVMINEYVDQLITDAAVGWKDDEERRGDAGICSEELHPLRPSSLIYNNSNAEPSLGENTDVDTTAITHEQDGNKQCSNLITDESLIVEKGFLESLNNEEVTVSDNTPPAHRIENVENVNDCNYSNTEEEEKKRNNKSPSFKVNINTMS